MKNNLPRLALLICLAALPAATTGCATFEKIKAALVSPSVARTVRIVGESSKIAVEDADKLWHAKNITDAQWHAIASAYDKYLPVYKAEVLALIDAHAEGKDAPPTASLTDAYRVVYAAYSAVRPGVLPVPDNSTK